MVVLVILILLTFGVSYFSKKSFGKCLPITLMSIPFVLYVSQFAFHSFHVGMWCILLLSVLGLGLTIYKIVKKDKEFIANIFSKGFFAFLLIFVAIYITDFEQQFSVWDELAHWGEMVKEMLRLDRFYSDGASLMIWHKDYPPFISLFEYFWCNILSYSEQTMNIALHCYMFGIFVPYVVDHLKKKINIFILPFLFLLTILAIDPYQIFKTIQTDLLISVMAVFPMFIVLWEKNSTFKNITLSLSILALLLTKQIGLPLAVMVFVFYILYEILIKHQKIKDFKFWIHSFLILILPVLAFIIWNLYTTMMQTGAQFSLGNINIIEYFNIVFKNEGVGYKLQAFSLFKEYLFTEPIIIKPFKIGYVYCYLIVVLLLTLIHLFHKKEFDLKKYGLHLFIFTCGTFFYALTISILYMFCFSEGETVTLACFGRYMSSYVLIEFLYLIGLILSLMEEKKYYTPKLIVIFCIFLLGINQNLKCLLPQKYFDDNYVEFKEIASIINPNTEENSKIFIIMQDYSYSYLLQYFLESRAICKEYNYLYDNIDTDPKDLVKETIWKQDYVYIQEYPEAFPSLYKEMFEGEIKEKTLYKVNKENKKLIEVER